MWKDDFDNRLSRSSSSRSEGSSGSAPTHISYSSGSYGSAQPQPSYSSGPYEYAQPQPSYSLGPCRFEPTECSKCKVKDLTINMLETRIKMLDATLEMIRNPEDHACS